MFLKTQKQIKAETKEKQLIKINECILIKTATQLWKLNWNYETKLRLKQLNKTEIKSWKSNSNLNRKRKEQLQLKLKSPKETK